MAVKQNTAEGGTAGTAVSIGNSGGLSGDAWSSVAAGTGGAITYSTTAHRGALGISMVNASAAVTCFVEMSDAANASASWTSRFDFWLNAYPSAAIQGPLGIRSAANGSVGRVELSATGQVRVVLGSSTSAYTTPTLALGTWYRFEVYGTGAGTASASMTCDVYVGDNTGTPYATATLTGITTSGAAVGIMRPGRLAAAGSNSWVIDNFAMDVTSATPLGPSTTAQTANATGALVATGTAAASVVTGIAVTTSTAQKYAGASSLLATKTITVAGSGQLLRVTDGAALRTLTGPTLSARVYVQASAGMSNVQVRVQLQDPSSAYQSGASVTVPTGAWTQVTYTPTAALLASCRACAVEITSDWSGTGTLTAYVDQVEQGTLTSGPAIWQAASQACVTAIRAAADTKTILVPGYQWSSIRAWAATHPVGWITDPAGNFLYEGHHFWDADYSGAYAATYTAEDTAAAGTGWIPGSWPDALTARTMTELTNWQAWLAANSARGMVGAVAWPRNIGGHTGDYASWSTLGERWYASADAGQLWVAYWAAGETLGAVTYSLYDPSGSVLAVQNSQAATVQAHPEFTATTFAAPYGRNTTGVRGVSQLMLRIGRGVAARSVSIPLPADAQLSWTAPGGDDTLTCTIPWPDRGIARPDAFTVNMPVRVEDRRTAEIVWEGRVADPGLSGDRAGQEFRLAAVGAGHDLDAIAVVKLYIDRDPASWVDIPLWQGGHMTVGTDAGAFVENQYDDIQVPPDYYLELPWPQGTTQSPGTTQRMSYLRGFYPSQDMDMADGSSATKGIAAVTPEVEGITFSWANGFPQGNQFELLGGGPDSGSTTGLYSVPFNATAAQIDVIMRESNPAWTRHDYTYFSFQQVRGGVSPATSSVDAWVRVANVIVVGRKFDRYGVDVAGVGGRFTSLHPYEMVEDMLGTILNGRFDPGQITADSAVFVDQAAWWEPTPVSTILDAVNDWNNDAWWGVWARANPDALPRLDYRSWNVAPRYTLDDTAEVQLAGGGETWANSALVTFARGNGTPSVTRVSISVPSVARIFGTAGTGTKATKTRDLAIDLTDKGPMSRANAAILAQQIVAASAAEKWSGSARVTRPLMDDVDGRPVQPWEIRPGWPVLVGSTPGRFTSGSPLVLDGESTFRLTKVTYSASDDSSQLEFDGGTRRLTNAPLAGARWKWVPVKNRRKNRH